MALLFVGRTTEWDSEGRDLPGLDLPGDQDLLIERVAAANPRTVVVLQSGGPVAMPWKDKVAAILQCWYPGQELGNGIADVLMGDAEPGGRLPQTFPSRLDANPTHGNYPGENGHVAYAEGVHIGYRHYDARGGEGVLFPFGHGLSYTEFALGETRLSAPSLGPAETLKVVTRLRNTGARPGKAVLQLYVAPPAGQERPLRELRGFRAVTLAPGAEAEVTIELTPRAFAGFDEARNAWVAPAGDYGILVGTSSADLPNRACVTLTSDWVAPCPARLG